MRRCVSLIFCVHLLHNLLYRLSYGCLNFRCLIFLQARVSGAHVFVSMIFAFFPEATIHQLYSRTPYHLTAVVHRNTPWPTTKPNLAVTVHTSGQVCNEQSVHCTARIPLGTPNWLPYQRVRSRGVHCNRTRAEFRE